MADESRGKICAAAAVVPPLALLWLDGGQELAARAFAFGLAGLVLAGRGQAPLWLVALAALPLIQLLPARAPVELAEAMAAAQVVGPGTIAVDPAAIGPEMLTLAGCLIAFALATTAARSSPVTAWWSAAAVALFGCFEAAAGLAGGPGSAGALVNRGQYAALLELTFGAGCGVAAASWFGRTWRERLEERALLGGIVGFGAAALSLAGITMSLSRAGIVAGGLLGLGAAAFFARTRPWALVAVAVIAIGLALSFPRLTHLASDRFGRLVAQGGDPGRSAVWADAIHLAEERWLAGVGLGSFPAAFRRSSFYLPRKGIDHAHSDYLEWCVELGVPAAVLLIGSVFVCVVAAARNAGRSRLSVGCLLGVGAILLHAAADLPLQSPGLAALAAALLGFSNGLSRPKRPSMRQAAVVLGLGAMLLAAANLRPAATPEALYRAAGEASAGGDLPEAVRLYRRALDRNLFAAPVWLRLAEIERSRGRDGRARLFFETAREVEPFALRTEWPLAEMELAAGDSQQAIRRLSGLTASALDLLDPALRTAWRSGALPADLERLVPRDNPEAAGRYLAFLVRNGLGGNLWDVYARLGEPPLPEDYRQWLAREAGFQP